MHGLPWDLRVSSEFSSELPTAFMSEKDSAIWLPGFKDISNGPRKQRMLIRDLNTH